MIPAESDAAAAGFQVKGWHVAAGVTAFFAVVIAVDLSFAVLAYRTHPGQVSVTPYEDGLLYNQRIAQLRAQAQLGWRETAETRPGRLILTYVDADGRPLEGLRIRGKLERPATETGRITPTFQTTAPGRYEASVGQLQGAWDLTTEARTGSDVAFIAERRLTW